LIKFQINISGIKELEKALLEIEKVLGNLMPYGRGIQREVLFKMKENFDFLDTRVTNESTYASNKGSLPVGVLTGKLQNAMSGSGIGSINQLIPMSTGFETGFNYIYGVDDGPFRNKYPLHFKKWLKSKGVDELVALTDYQAEMIADDFFADIVASIERAIGGGG